VSEKSLASFITIENGGSLFVKGIHFNSAYKTFGDVQSAVITTTKAMLKHYNLTMQDCEFYNFNENNYACFRANKSTFGDSVVFDHCVFRNMSGAAIDMSSEKDDKGMYNAERIIIKNCVFYNMLANAINIYRGGNDESTTGPSVTIDHCIFNDVDNREQGAVIKLLGVQYARVINSSFYNCGQGGRSIWFEELAWDDIKVDHCNFYNAGKVQSFHGNIVGKHITHFMPSKLNLNQSFPILN
jgi:poly(beta-D-mannuronate) lyase